MISGYLFKIVVEEGEKGYIAIAPGVGGVYEEGKTPQEAEKKAYESACVILETRFERNDLIEEDSEYLKVVEGLPNINEINKKSPAENDYLMTLLHCDSNASPTTRKKMVKTG